MWLAGVDGVVVPAYVPPPKLLLLLLFFNNTKYNVHFLLANIGQYSFDILCKWYLGRIKIFVRLNI